MLTAAAVTHVSRRVTQTWVTTENRGIMVVARLPRGPEAPDWDEAPALRDGLELYFSRLCSTAPITAPIVARSAVIIVLVVRL